MKTLDGATTIVAFTMSLAFVAIKFKLLAQNHRDRRSAGLWLFGLSMATGFMFRLSYVYAWFDSLVSVNNLAWLLSCLFLTFAIYVLAGISCVGIYRDENFRKLQWATTGGLVLTYAVFMFFFWRDVARGPEYYYPGSVIPIDRGSLVVKTVMLSYSSLVTLIPIRVYHRLFRDEMMLPAKIRWFFAKVLSVDAILLFLSRLILAVAGYFFALPALIVTSITVIIIITQGLFIFWPLAFLPSRAYAFLSRPIAYLEKLFVLQNLTTLERACRKLPGLSSPALPNPVSRWDHLSHPDLSVYKSIIAILDYKSCLKRDQVTDDKRWLEELLHICDETDYQAQVQAYSQLGAKLRKQVI
jgi:hypothetical protein